jgi:hypothetical protein
MVADQVFYLKDGFYCIVNGKVFGTWDTKEIAEAGMQVEQRRAAAWKAKEKAALELLCVAPSHPFCPDVNGDGEPCDWCKDVAALVGGTK